jgi:hypothetical protein
MIRLSDSKRVVLATLRDGIVSPVSASLSARSRQVPNSPTALAELRRIGPSAEAAQRVWEPRTEGLI